MVMFWLEEGRVRSGAISAKTAMELQLSCQLISIARPVWTISQIQ